MWFSLFITTTKSKNIFELTSANKCQCIDNIQNSDDSAIIIQLNSWKYAIVHQCFLMTLPRKIIIRKPTLHTTNKFFLIKYLNMLFQSFHILFLLISYTWNFWKGKVPKYDNYKEKKTCKDSISKHNKVNC